MDPEFVHVNAFRLGEFLGNISILRSLLAHSFNKKNPYLRQELVGLSFDGPIGLAAGFDYEARLTKVLAPLGFGFQTIGTISNLYCEGNQKPRLKRLPKSQALLVNKGFKNPGSEEIIQKLSGQSFEIPIGVSIGRTNVPYQMSLEDSIADIVCCFAKFEKSKINISYYELNISCPNLFGDVSFYPKENLRKLLIAVDKLRTTKPIFVKMPIEKSDAEVLEMLEVISEYFPKGVIFGNLQKNRSHESLNKKEVQECGKGNFSGKPTFDRSNELISLTYRHYKDRFIVIGCGGVFSAEDAFEKIQRGASLVQLITGMVYNGPQLISEINSGLKDLLEKKGFSSLCRAVGSFQQE